MSNPLIRTTVGGLLRLRYRLRVSGRDEVARKGTSGILFLPNHPAFIDPIIVLTVLNHPFRPRALGDQDQIDRPVIRQIARRIGVIPVADVAKHGASAREAVEKTIETCAALLNAGENVMIYPAGHLYRTRYEDLHGNSAAETLLRLAPQARVVLVRTRGLWGSSFSLASGEVPQIGKVLSHATRSLLKSGIFFAPRRNVSIELVEPTDLPRGAGRDALNQYLEKFYNDGAPPATYVPYTPWDSQGRRELPEPEYARPIGDVSEVPQTTREIVLKFLRELTKTDSLKVEDRLAQDLGMDSLARTELLLWLTREFGFAAGDTASLQTVGDVMLAARGQASAARPVPLKPIAPLWFQSHGAARLKPPTEPTLAAAFLARAREQPGRAAIADQLGGVKSYRDLLTAVLALRPAFERLPGERIGILLPASSAACVAYLTALFAGKTPVMVNWTTGARNLAHALDVCKVERVITSGALIARLMSQGLELGPIESRFTHLEEIGKRLSKWDKLKAAISARLGAGSLRSARIQDVATILLTSGSESLPKAVPLTHTNILTNIRDVLTTVALRDDDRMLSFLPPFHSFGLVVNMLMPLTSGMRSVFHANPTEPWVLAKLTEAYGATVLAGTPTFLNGIVRAARPGQLATLRMAVTGAEKCPDRVYDALMAACPGAVVLEGYGITECSPIVSANREADARRGAIGHIFPSVEAVILDEERGAAAAVDQPGMLLVRGPSIFDGYLGDAPSPFVEHDGKRWYRTGDLVSRDAAGVLTFRGRLKRFVKMGGEMISLPAVEGALEAALAREDDDGPCVAVEATASEEHPELVLVTTRDIDRTQANKVIRDAGLSALHNIVRVRRVDAIPVLGTGKTDYRAVKSMLND